MNEVYHNQQKGIGMPHEGFLMPNIAVMRLAAKDIDELCGGDGSGKEFLQQHLTAAQRPFNSSTNRK